MKNLTKAELYKLYKSLSYKVLMIGILVYSISDLYFAYINGESINGFQAIVDSTGSWQRSLLIVGIFAGIFIAGDFTNRGIQMQLSVGNSRVAVLLAKGIAYWLGGLLLAVLYQISYVAVYFFTYGFGIRMSTDALMCIVQLEGAFLSLFSVFLAVCILIAYIFRDIYVVTVAETLFAILGTSIFQSFGRSQGILQVLYVGKICRLYQFAVSPVKVGGNMKLIVMPPDKLLKAFSQEWPNGLFIEMGMGIIMTFLILGISYIVFRRADLK